MQLNHKFYRHFFRDWFKWSDEYINEIKKFDWRYPLIHTCMQQQIERIKGSFCINMYDWDCFKLDLPIKSVFAITVWYTHIISCFVDVMWHYIQRSNTSMHVSVNLYLNFWFIVRLSDTKSQLVLGQLIYMHNVKHTLWLLVHWILFVKIVDLLNSTDTV